jgi:hypothetical protein
LKREHRRLADITAGRGDWQRWGTYVSDCAWGTVREDCSHDNERVPLKIHSRVGLVPLSTAAVVEPSMVAKLPVVMQTVGNVLNRREFFRSILPTFVESGVDGTRLLTVVNRVRLAAILQRVLDEAQFLSEFGVVSREYAAHPYSFQERLRTGNESAAVQGGKVA